MKTLIFNGSPRKNGETVALINEFVKHIKGEYKIVDAYNCNIKPCIDCRYCWKKDGCSQIDEMQEIYEYIQECDNILIASPIYFTELTGQLLAVTSRLQTYFCAKFIRKEIPIKKEKKGGVILVQGGAGPADTGYKTACVLLENMNTKCIYPPIYFKNTDNQSINKDEESINRLKQIASSFNE